MHFHCFNPNIFTTNVWVCGFPYRIVQFHCFTHIALGAITFLEFSYFFETKEPPQLKAIANIQPVLMLLLLHGHTKLDLRINFYNIFLFLPDAIILLNIFRI